MLDVAVDARTRTDDAVRSLLISRAGEAQRLANWILHTALPDLPDLGCGQDMESGGVPGTVTPSP